MKLTTPTNVVSLFAGSAERTPSKPASLGERQRDRRFDRRLDRRVGLLEQLKRQTADYECAIQDAESARLTLDASSRGAVEALERFENALANLRLSLQNHRETCARIETAQLAGEAAALVSAQILGDGSNALGCHVLSAETELLHII